MRRCWQTMGQFRSFAHFPHLSNDTAKQCRSFVFHIYPLLSLDISLLFLFIFLLLFFYFFFCAIILAILRGGGDVPVGNPRYCEGDGKGNERMMQAYRLLATLAACNTWRRCRCRRRCDCVCFCCMSNICCTCCWSSQGSEGNHMVTT